ncbi:MAG: hypothetical protein FJ317_05795, partial [SAR202 cluster bacterium]|nr:hypothetical protein [SAR202 cluster bacterium]
MSGHLNLMEQVRVAARQYQYWSIRILSRKEVAMRRDGTATLHNRLSGPFAALAVAAAMVAGQITLGAPEAYACSCAPSNTQQYIDRADVVLVGRAVSVENTWEGKSTFSSADPRLVEFEVERYYKGTGPDYVIVSNPMGSASCGYFTDDAPGMRFLLFVKSSRE